MITIGQGRVSRFTPTKIGLNITIEILSEDLDRETRDSIESLWKDGTPIAGVFQEFQDEQRGSDKGILCLRLEALQRSVAMRKGKTFDEIENDLLKRYGVKNTKKLSISEIEHEIKILKDI